MRGTANDTAAAHAARVLERVPMWARVMLANGGRILSRRTFPFPPKFTVVDHDGAHGRELPRPALLDLVEQRVIDGRALDDAFDAIDYTVTEIGRVRLARWSTRAGLR